MNLFRALVGAGLAVALSGGAMAASSTDWEQWMSDYYKNPAPAKVTAAAFGLTESGYLQKPGAVGTAIGFFSQVFASNKEMVDRWFTLFEYLPGESQRLMAVALWYSGDSRGESALRKQLFNSRHAAEIDALLRERRSPSVASTPVLTASSMNLQWGAFLATGNAEPVRNILAAMGRRDVGDAARMSLAVNAARHDRVLELCRDMLQAQPQAVQSDLRAVINQAEGRAQPTS